jgi:hypothetical protein
LKIEILLIIIKTKYDFFVIADIKRFLTDFYTDLPGDESGKAFKYCKQLVNKKFNLFY